MVLMGEMSEGTGEDEQIRKETEEKAPLAFQLKKEKKATCKVVRPNKGSSAELCTRGR